jgi:DnaJ-class molecular chaperone
VSSTPATSTLTTATHGSGMGSASIDLAATVHTATQAATVALIVTAVISFYLLTCLVWPFGKCRRCKGAGKFKSPFGRAYRHCGTCEGSGLRVRVGRHVINHIRATRGAGTNSVSKGDQK